MTLVRWLAIPSVVAAILLTASYFPFDHPGAIAQIMDAQERAAARLSQLPPVTETGTVTTGSVVAPRPSRRLSGGGHRHERRSD